MNDRASSAPKDLQPAKRARVRGTPKGRTVDPKAREEVRALLKDAPLRRDLLIEHLHRIQDRYAHLSAAHLVALADEMRSEEHTSELQSRRDLVCRLLLEKKNKEQEGRGC